MPDPTTTATEARRAFGDLLRRVAGGERVVIESHGRAVAAVVPVADAELLEALGRFLVGRDVHADLCAEEDCSAVFPGIQPLTL